MWYVVSKQVGGCLVRRIIAQYQDRSPLCQRTSFHVELVHVSAWRLVHIDTPNHVSFFRVFEPWSILTQCF